MIVYNIVVRIDNDKDFLDPIFQCLGQLKKAGVTVQFNVIGKVYNENIYDKLILLSKNLGIIENVFFSRNSISYADMGDELKEGFFLNYSLDDVVGYSTMEAMNMGLKTILFNCDRAITESSKRISFCNTIADLYDLTMKLVTNQTETTRLIVKDNNDFQETFFLTSRESDLLLGMF